MSCRQPPRASGVVSRPGVSRRVNMIPSGTGEQTPVIVPVLEARGSLRRVQCRVRVGCPSSSVLFPSSFWAIGLLTIPCAEKYVLALPRFCRMSMSYSRCVLHDRLTARSALCLSYCSYSRMYVCRRHSEAAHRRLTVCQVGQINTSTVPRGIAMVNRFSVFGSAADSEIDAITG